MLTFMVRLNQNEVKKVKNGKVTHLTGDLYLLEATNKSVTITLRQNRENADEDMFNS